MSDQPNPVPHLHKIRYWLNWLTISLAAGKWDSTSLGEGFKRQNHTEYENDPDFTRIDWPLSLISEDLMVSQYAKKRQLQVHLLVDLGPSMDFGSILTKKDRLALIAAVLSYSAQKFKDNFTCLGYTDTVEKIFLPFKDKTYPYLLAEAIMNFKSNGSGGLPYAALEVTSRKSLVIIISDFQGDPENTKRALKTLTTRHEVLPLVVWDKREVTLPEKARGFYPFHDLATGEFSYVFMNSRNKERFAQNSLRRRQDIEAIFVHYDVKPHFLISDGDDDIAALMRIFFARRNRL